MTEFQIKLLSANNKSALNLDSLKIFNNIKKEHAFTSIADATDAIWQTIMKAINPDNPEMMADGDLFSPLFINTIDDAICSIIYELYQCDNGDLLLMIQHVLMMMADTLDVYKPIYECKDNRIKRLAEKIKNILAILGIYGLDLTNRRAISLNYYDIMHYLYSNKKIKTKDDNIIINYYKQLYDGVYTNPESH